MAMNAPEGLSVDVPLSLGIDVSAIPAAPVGAGQYTIEIVRALCRREDLTLTLFSRRDDAKRWEGIGASDMARVVPRAPRRRLARLSWEEFGLNAALRRERPALEVFFGPHYTMPSSSSIPCVVTVHDLTFIEHPEWHERSKAMYFRRALRIAARRARGIICVSNTTREHFLSHFEPRGKVFVVPHGIDHERFSPREPHGGADEAVLARLGVKEPFVVHVGTIEPRKDVVTLLRAFERVAQSQGDCALVLAGGRGWRSDAFERELSSLRARDRVQLLGYVANDDVPALLRRSSVVAYPSLDEGFGLPALEALSCGAALVTTKGTAMADLAGDAAFTIERGDPVGLADAIMASMRERDQSSVRRELGIAIAAKYSWATSAQGHFAAFRDVVGR